MLPGRDFPSRTPYHPAPFAQEGGAEARPRKTSPYVRAGFIACLLSFAAPAARGGETAALYQVYWAGLAAGDIRLTLRDETGGYRSQIEIRSAGLPAVVTRFRG